MLQTSFRYFSNDNYQHHLTHDSVVHDFVVLYIVRFAVFFIFKEYKVSFLNIISNSFFIYFKILLQKSQLVCCKSVNILVNFIIL